jgi:hypothetical protein
MFVQKIVNGSHYTVSQGDQEIDIIHLYGPPYDWGFAQGALMKDRLLNSIPGVYSYAESQISSKNSTFAKWVEEVGLSAALGLSFDATKSSLQPYVM